jgi:circadian clock protein KaiC
MSNKVIIQRLTTDVPGFDLLLGDGLPESSFNLIAGTPGSGKTTLVHQIMFSLARPEKSPSQLLSHRLHTLVKAGQVGVIDTRSLDLSIDEILYDLVEMIENMKAKRVVIDSLSGFELALAPEFREDYRESLYRMISVLLTWA